MALKPPKRDPSSGSIHLVEQLGGGVRLVLEVDEIDGTDSTTMARIKAGIAGLSYIYKNDGHNIENIGKAYIDGLEEGIERSNKMNKPAKSSNYKKTKIGFQSIEDSKEVEEDNES